jgi:hypothetical protein
MRGEITEAETRLSLCAIAIGSPHLSREELFHEPRVLGGAANIDAPGSDQNKDCGQSYQRERDFDMIWDWC